MYIWSREPIFDNIYHKIVRKIFWIFTFGTYFRLFIEGILMIQLSSTTEIMNFQALDSKRVASMAFAILFWVITVWFLIFVFLKWFKSRKTLEIHVYYEELFAGTKQTHFSHAYTLVFIFKRVTFWFLITFLEALPLMLKLSLLFLIECWVLVYLILVRPFDEVKVNIIEIVNEIFFM